MAETSSLAGISPAQGVTEYDGRGECPALFKLGDASLRPDGEKKARTEVRAN
jgi:hypothetical protein